MKLERLVGDRFKERPSDCVIDSHALMLRGGYMKYVANGIFSSYMPLRRITRKIEAIIREEMDAIDGQEVQFPVVMPASLWEESGRYQSVGSELMRLSDRNGSPLVLGMTHEEAAVQLVREYGQSYSKYPFMIYQIQTKFRDEARPRAGLIRVREFTMKDAYSFHTSQEDLEQYYARCYHAYERIFARAGIPETVAMPSSTVNTLPVVCTSALGVQLSSVSRRSGITFCSDTSTAFKRSANCSNRPCGLQSYTSSPDSRRKPFSSV